MRLLNKHLKLYREYAVKEQGGLCGICMLPFTTKDPAVLDHDHEPPGNVRLVLHRSCNVILGKMENARKRTGMSKKQMLAFMKNIHSFYLKDYSKNPIHPGSLSDSEKELKRLKKYYRRLRKKESKDKCTTRMNELKEIINNERKNSWRPK